MSEQPTATLPITPDEQAPKGDAFILGGDDLEMRHAERRIREASARILGEMTTWEDADIDKRQGEIKEAQAHGLTPVLIEHRGADIVDGVVHIDHHGENVGRNASIMQVLERLGVDPNFVDKIIAANDSGYIPGMETFLDGQYRSGFIQKRINAATKRGVPAEAAKQDAEARYQRVRAEIIERVRLKDREAQGVTAEDEQEAIEAIKNMED